MCNRKFLKRVHFPDTAVFVESEHLFELTLMLNKISKLELADCHDQVEFEAYSTTEKLELIEP